MSLTYWNTRKLDIWEGLALPVEPEHVMEFLTNAKNAKRINGLVEDICEALMDYQVRRSDHSSSTISDLCDRLHYNMIFIMKVVNLLWVSPPSLSAHRLTTR